MFTFRVLPFQSIISPSLARIRTSKHPFTDVCRLRELRKLPITHILSFFTIACSLWSCQITVMEDIMLPPPSLHGTIDRHQSPEKLNVSTNQRPRLASFSASRDSSISWGRRHHHGSWLQALGCLSIMVLCPCLVIFYGITLSSFDGSLTIAYSFMWQAGPTNFYRQYAPRTDIKVNIAYGAWLLFQIALYQFLPSKLSTGQLTPAGNLLRYRTNGLLAWVITHMLYLGASFCGILDPAMLAKNWQALIVSFNVFGFLLSGLAYVKAYLSPTHEGDRKFSGESSIFTWQVEADGEPGSMLYDLYMGIELNPRFGKYFDFKLFTNGRPGIIAWALM